MIERVPLLVLLLSLAACSTSEALRPHIDRDPASLLKTNGYRIEVEVSEARLVQGDILVNGQKMLDQSRSSAPMVQASGAGNSMGASAAGVMIGGILVSQLNKTRVKSDARTEAEQLVAPLRLATAGTGLDQWFEEQLRAELASGLLGQVVQNSPYTVRFEPQAELGHALDSIRLITEVTVTFGHEVLYKGRIEVLDAADWKPESTATIGLDPWLADQGQPYKNALQAGISETARVLALDLESQHFANKPGVEQTLRYTLGTGRFVERGRLLSDDGQRALFMDLRGWLKSVPIQTATR